MDPSSLTITNNNNGDHDHQDYGGLLQKDPTNNNIIVKGKRTKRQRLQSAIPFTIVPHNSSTSYNTLNSSPATSSDFRASNISTTTEDEDTAQCLILLSKGHYAVSSSPNVEEFSSFKFNSKKYIQTSTDEYGSSTGTYVYECKTCSRIFSSFQALGGHRASHRKPKINELDKRKPYMTTFSDNEDEPSPQPLKMIKNNNSSSSSSLSHQIINKKSSNSSKLHECSICGTEFNSGQALGGHMRRHRPVNNNNNNNTTVARIMTATNTTLSLVPYVEPVTTTTMVVKDYEINNDDHKSRNDGLFLDLDLNLPAPPETTVTVVADAVNQDRESSFKFMTNNQNKQQPAVHLSTTPTLVDCHY